MGQRSGALEAALSGQKRHHLMLAGEQSLSGTKGDCSEWLQPREATAMAAKHRRSQAGGWPVLAV
jgi:hypothetical protein